MNQLTNYWLSILCSMIKGATRAVVFSAAQDTVSYTPTAFWPKDNIDIKDFTPAVKATLLKKECVLLQQNTSDRETGEPLDIIACPLFLDEQLHGVIVMQTSSSTHAKQQTAMEEVKRAAVWLEAIINQRTSTQKSQLVTLVELVASCIEHERFEEAATDVVTDLATRFSGDRVSIGFMHGHDVKVEAISHSAGFDRKSSLIQNIEQAMHEVMDQGSTIAYPVTTETTVHLTRSHAALAETHGTGTILTIPFTVNGEITGAVLVERPAELPFDRVTTEHFEQIVSMIGPVLEIRRRDEQLLLQRLNNSFKRFFSNIFGPGHIALKLILASLFLCLAFLAFISGDYRITGTARLEAQTQLAVVASQDGYIAEANVRPGDIIQRDDLLGSLDDKNLKLEYRKWSSQLAQLQKEHRNALAKHDRSKVSIIKAKTLKAEAQLALVNEQLIRIRFTAPFDGLVVSGDLSHALGSPVERGQVLFTVAPLDAYRVILKVDERDIGSVKEGQNGNLVLSGMPGKPLRFTVEKITPVSMVEEGRNYFQVEAKVDKNLDLLRPGMEGVAKITVGRQKLIWIWTHRLVDWMRLTLWAWLP
jgi:hypothetical protein